MKNKIISIYISIIRFVLFVFILCCNLTSYSQWVQTDGPIGTTSVSSVFQGSTQVFATTNCGFYESSRIEQQWEYFNDLDIQVYDQTGDSLFYYDKEIGVALMDLSIDNPTSSSMGLDGEITSLKSVATRLFAGNQYKGLAKKAGHTQKWTYHNDGLPVEIRYTVRTLVPYNVWHINSIERLGEVLVCGTHKGVYQSDINSISWTVSNNGIPELEIGLVEVIEGVLFACQDKALYTSYDGGNSWEKTHEFPSSIQAIIKLNGVHYLATARDGVSKSHDLNTWTSLNTGLSDFRINTLNAIDGTLVCGTPTTGFHYLANDIWISNNSGVVCSTIRSMTTTDSALISNDNTKIYTSREGQNWTDISPEGDYNFCGSVDAKSDTIFASFNYAFPLHGSSFVMYSLDNGTSWEGLTNYPQFTHDDSYRIYYDKGVLYVYENFYMCKTTDLGMTWDDMRLPQKYCNQFDDFMIYKDQVFALACGSAQLLKRVDNRWILSNEGIPYNLRVDALAHTSDAIYAYLQNKGMYISKDTGRSWKKASNGIPLFLIVRSFAFVDHCLFIATNSGVFYTDNYGKNWYELNDGLPNTNTSAITTFRDTLFLGTYGNGVWKRSIDNIPLRTFAPEAKPNLVISPNPASQFINIEFPSEDNYDILIYDLMGRLVMSMQMKKPSSLNISMIPPGTYILKLNSVIGSRSTKLNIIR